MQKVSFYFNIRQLEDALCQLVGKASKQGLTIGIASANPRRLNRLLWENPPLGFVPHCMSDDALAPQTPVWISTDLQQLAGRQVLFNCSSEQVPRELQIGRVIEMVARGDEAGRQLARQKVQQYRQDGYEVEFTDMDQLASKEQ